MKKTEDVNFGSLSRRSVLAGAGVAVSAGALMALAPSNATAQAKIAQAAVAYQDSPKGAQQCDNCNLFQPPNACKTVAGEVSPQGWCKIYSKKPS